MRTKLIIITISLVNLVIRVKNYYKFNSLEYKSIPLHHELINVMYELSHIVQVINLEK